MNRFPVRSSEIIPINKHDIEPSKYPLVSKFTLSESDIGAAVTISTESTGELLITFGFSFKPIGWNEFALNLVDH